MIVMARTPRTQLTSSVYVFLPSHRWIPQRTKGPYFHVPEVEEGIRNLMRSVVAQEVAEKPRIHAITSRLEGKGDAIAILDHMEVNAASRGLFREVIHLHSVSRIICTTASRGLALKRSVPLQQDLSFHAVLSPACAAEVVTKKWGERFAISGRPHVLGPLRGKVIHPGMVLLYPPKTMDELDVIRKIIIAGIDYALDLGSDGLDADCDDMEAVKELAE